MRTTYGGFANGIPRNFVTESTATPITVAESSLAMAPGDGPVA